MILNARLLYEAFEIFDESVTDEPYVEETTRDWCPIHQPVIFGDFLLNIVYVMPIY